MSELDDFLSQAIPRHRQATTGVRNGDATSFVEHLSHRDPVTLFPASQPAQTGWASVSQAIRRVASAYSASNVVEFDVIAAGLSGDLAYLVGYERAVSSIEAGAAQDLSLRITQIYRREAGEWMLVHRHADPGPDDSAGVEQLRKAMRHQLER
jgi:ketosteroid isomerase-like protein